MASVARIIISRTIGFLIFLILLAIANWMTGNINSEIYANIVQFFNSNLLLLFVLFVIGTVNEIFWSFYFPFNAVAPLISGFLSIFVVTFIYRMWLFIESYVNTGVVIPIYAIYPIVAILTVIIGYIVIAARGGKPREEWEKPEYEKWRRERRKLEEKIKKIDKRIKNKERVEWEDVGEQFKLAFYNLGKMLSDAFDKK